MAFEIEWKVSEIDLSRVLGENLLEELQKIFLLI
jgi:hypothetical protein